MQIDKEWMLMEALGWGGGPRNVPGKIFNFRFKFIAFTALLMGFIFRYPQTHIDGYALLLLLLLLFAGGGGGARPHRPPPGSYTVPMCTLPGMWREILNFILDDWTLITASCARSL